MKIAKKEKQPLPEKNPKQIPKKKIKKYKLHLFSKFFFDSATRFLNTQIPSVLRIILQKKSGKNKKKKQRNNEIRSPSFYPKKTNTEIKSKHSPDTFTDHTSKTKKNENKKKKNRTAV